MKRAFYNGSYRYATALDIGLRRESNQDELVLAPDIGFFGVSDGMGGLSMGELASRYVKDAFPLLLRDALGTAASLSVSEAERLLREGAVCLSDRLYREVNAKGTVMGATLCCVWLVEDKAVFVSLGDSRGYVLRRREKLPTQITEDMNLAGLLLREGAISPEEARKHPGKSQLTAYVGMPSPATPEVYVCDLRRGDSILLCSDGLYGMTEERQLAKLMRSSRNPQAVCGRLVRAAKAGGGRDNISAVYLRF